MNHTEIPGIEIIETPDLGDRTYLISAEGSAVVIDPQRDVDRILERLDADTRITHILETHIHNDYVSGGLDLARRTGAEYGVSAQDNVGFPRRPVEDGDVIEAGAISLTAVHTPGHTPNHLSYLVEAAGQRSIFTGGSLLYGTVGRTDLIAPERTEPLLRAQYHSARRLAGELAPEIGVFPTHGFGSFCASAGGDASVTTSTIGRERSTNLALTTSDEDRFVRIVLGGLGEYPRYYEHMGRLNSVGPAPLDLTPPPLIEMDELIRQIDAGRWAIDVRPRAAFAASHLAGTVHIEMGNQLATMVGWLHPWGQPLYLLGDDREALAEARRMLARIGIDEVVGERTLEPHLGGESYPVADFPALADSTDEGRVVLDVRRSEEWASGHIADATHIPIHDLNSRLDEVPPGTVWVHCAAGFRASIAASILDRAGRDVVLIDDNFDNATAAGLPITT